MLSEVPSFSHTIFSQSTETAEEILLASHLKMKVSSFDQDETWETDLDNVNFNVRFHSVLSFKLELE